MAFYVHISHKLITITCHLPMSHFKKLIVILLLFSSLVFAQKLTPAYQTNLPLRFDTGNNAPYGAPSTVISIQGKDLPILFDTGAKNSELVLSQSALENLRVKFTGKKKCFKAFDGRHCQKEFIIPEVKLGTFTVKNVKGTLMEKLWGGNDANFKETEASRNGVIGFALLSKFNVLLDYPNAKVLLIKPTNQPFGFNFKRWVSMPFTGHLNTALKINGKLINVSWDTGAIPSVIRKTVASNFKNVPCPGNAPYSRKDCMSVETLSFTTDKDEELPNTWFKITDIPAYAPFDALIGANFYKENLVYFDFKNHRIYVKHQIPNMFQDID